MDWPNGFAWSLLIRGTAKRSVVAIVVGPKLQCMPWAVCMICAVCGAWTAGYISWTVAGREHSFSNICIPCCSSLSRRPASSAVWGFVEEIPGRQHFICICQFQVAVFFGRIVGALNGDEACVRCPVSGVTPLDQGPTDEPVGVLGVCARMGANLSLAYLPPPFASVRIARQRDG